MLGANTTMKSAGYTEEQVKFIVQCATQEHRSEIERLKAEIAQLMLTATALREQAESLRAELEKSDRSALKEYNQVMNSGDIDAMTIAIKKPSNGVVIETKSREYYDKVLIKDSNLYAVIKTVSGLQLLKCIHFVGTEDLGENIFCRKKDQEMWVPTYLVRHWTEAK